MAVYSATLLAALNTPHPAINSRSCQESRGRLRGNVTSSLTCHPRTTDHLSSPTFATALSDMAFARHGTYWVFDYIAHAFRTTRRRRIKTLFSIVRLYAIYESALKGIFQDEVRVVLYGIAIVICCYGCD
jgi:hypothetical protein